MNQPQPKLLPPLDSRIPEWDFDDLVERDCPLCNSLSEKSLYKRPDGLSVRYCDNCQTWYISPAPSENQLSQFYENYQDCHGRVPLSSAQQTAALYDLVNPMKDIRIRELRSVLNFTGINVLDVGFGKGQFLYLLKRLGAIPYGFELDKQAIEAARELQITVIEENIVDYTGSLKFDLVSLLDLVEHPLKPMDLLKKSTSLLKPGGFLLIWTPNGAFAWMDTDLVTFRVDLEHMQYLSPNSCLKIASDLNLKVVHIEGLGFPKLSGIERSIQRKSSLTNKVKDLCRSFPGFMLLNRFRHRLTYNEPDPRTGNYHLFCILQKPIDHQ